MSDFLYWMAWVQSQPGVTYIDVGGNEPDHNIVWVILSTFALIGISLLIMLGLGVGLGALRIWIFQHFPGNKLNGPEYEVMTRLHLNDPPRADSTPS